MAETEKQMEETMVIGLSGYPLDVVARVIKTMSESDLSVELFDAFLHYYDESTDIESALQSAMWEWDVLFS